MCTDILFEILDNIDSLMLLIICKFIVLETIIPEPELRVETNWIMQMIAESRMLGLEGQGQGEVSRQEKRRGHGQYEDGEDEEEKHQGAGVGR